MGTTLIFVGQVVVTDHAGLYSLIGLGVQ
jgi:hypothetical protein